MDLDIADHSSEWDCTAPLKAVADLNDQFLELLADQALLRAIPAPTLLRDLFDLWCRLDPASRRRAAACPFALVDAGFTDPYRWRWVNEHRIGDREPSALAPFFTVARLKTTAYQVFSQAWWVAERHAIGAPLYLGMPPQCVSLFRACSMRQITELADQHPGWLRPRWAGRISLWKNLLASAIANDGLALERARMHGVQLLATELRALEQVHAAERR